MKLPTQETHRPAGKDDLGVVLVAWAPAAETPWAQVSQGLNDAVRTLFPEESEAWAAPTQDVWEQLARNDRRLAYCSGTVGAMKAAIERALAEGAQQIVVVPVVFALETVDAMGASRQELLNLLERMEKRHPEVEIVYIGPPYTRRDRLELLLDRIGQYEPDTAEMVKGVVARGFRDDWALFAQFMRRLQGALPPDTQVALRGSAVTGYSYVSRRPFDHRGPGTSDLDLVLVGEAAMAAWKPEAFYVPDVNTMPLSDSMPDIAPRFNHVREELQALVGRPVNMQAMPRWFLDLRYVVQGIPYVFLDSLTLP
ncbi:MAG: hypothetical protein Kow00120_01220 [Anaerolineae bacterium]